MKGCIKGVLLNRKGSFERISCHVNVKAVKGSPGRARGTREASGGKIKLRRVRETEHLLAMFHRVKDVKDCLPSYLT